MADKPKLKPKLPVDAVKMKCVSCGSSNWTRAVYQHDHEETVVSWEMPAYTNTEGNVPYNMPCLCGEKYVWAVYVECGECGYIACVDNQNKRVVPPKKGGA